MEIYDVFVIIYVAFDAIAGVIPHSTIIVFQGTFGYRRVNSLNVDGS